MQTSRPAGPRRRTRAEAGLVSRMVGYAGADSRRRRRDAIFCVAITGCVVLMMLLALRPMLGLFLLSLGSGASLLPRKHWTRERLALACCTCGACLLCGGLGYRHYLRMPAPALPPLPSQPDEAPAPPRPPAQPTALSSCSFLRHRSYTTACAQHGHSRAACSRRYVRVHEAGVELTSMCMYNWQEGTCVTAEARYECRKLGLSSGFAWNLLRALLLLLGLTIGLPVLLPWVQRQLPSYGLMSEAQYEAQCERTTERELAKLRSHVQMRGLPSTLSAHAQDRTKTFAEGLSGFRRLDALRWSGRLGSGLGSGSGLGLGFGSGFGFGLGLA